MAVLSVQWPLYLALFVLLHQVDFGVAGYYEAPLPYRQEILDATELPCGSEREVKPGEKYLFDSRSAILYESSSYYSSQYRRKRDSRDEDDKSKRAIQNGNSITVVISNNTPNNLREGRAYGGQSGKGYTSEGKGYGTSRGGGSYGHNYGSGGAGHHSGYTSSGGGSSYSEGGSYNYGSQYSVQPITCEWVYFANPNCSLEAHIVRFKPGDKDCLKQQFIISDNHTEFKMCGYEKLYPAFRAETATLYIKYWRQPYTYRHVFKGYVTCVGRAQRPKFESQEHYSKYNFTLKSSSANHLHSSAYTEEPTYKANDKGQTHNNTNYNSTQGSAHNSTSNNTRPSSSKTFAINNLHNAMIHPGGGDHQQSQLNPKDPVYQPANNAMLEGQKSLAQAAILNLQQAESSSLQLEAKKDHIDRAMQTLSIMKSMLELAHAHPQPHPQLLQRDGAHPHHHVGNHSIVQAEAHQNEEHKVSQVKEQDESQTVSEHNTVEQLHQQQEPETVSDHTNAQQEKQVLIAEEQDQEQRQTAVQPEHQEEEEHIVVQDENSKPQPADQSGHQEETHVVQDENSIPQPTDQHGDQEEQHIAVEDENSKPQPVEQQEQHIVVQDEDSKPQPVEQHGDQEEQNIVVQDENSKPQPAEQLDDQEQHIVVQDEDSKPQPAEQQEQHIVVQDEDSKPQPVEQHGDQEEQHIVVQEENSKPQLAEQLDDQEQHIVVQDEDSKPQPAEQLGHQEQHNVVQHASSEPQSEVQQEEKQPAAVSDHSLSSEQTHESMEQVLVVVEQTHEQPQKASVSDHHSSQQKQEQPQETVVSEQTHENEHNQETVEKVSDHHEQRQSDNQAQPEIQKTPQVIQAVNPAHAVPVVSQPQPQQTSNVNTNEAQYKETVASYSNLHKPFKQPEVHETPPPYVPPKLQPQYSPTSQHYPGTSATYSNHPTNPFYLSNLYNYGSRNHEGVPEAETPLPAGRSHEEDDEAKSYHRGGTTNHASHIYQSRADVPVSQSYPVKTPNTYPYITPPSTGVPQSPSGYQYIVSSPGNPSVKYLVTCQLPPPYPCTPPTYGGGAYVSQPKPVGVPVMYGG